MSRAHDVRSEKWRVHRTKAGKWVALTPYTQWMSNGEWVMSGTDRVFEFFENAMFYADKMARR